MRRKVLTMLLTMAMVFAYSMPALNQDAVVNAAVSKTQNEAIAWVQSQLGKGIDDDGVNGNQCVDLIRAYYKALGVSPVSGSGKDYATNSLPSGWSRVKGGTPQKGDVLVYNASSSNEHGHVAIYESDYVTYHQNFNGHAYVEKVTTIKYNALPNSYWGYIRPNWSNAPSGSVVTIPAGVYSIHSALNNNLVLDIADGKNANGTNIQTQNYHGGPAQRFNVIHKGEYYMIYPQCATTKCIDTEADSSTAGANIFTWEETGAKGQHWEFVDAGGGYYYIRSKQGLYLDVKDGKNAIQVNIQGWSFNGSNAQKWKLVEEKGSLTEGYYSIHNAKDSNLVLNIDGGSAQGGANLNLYSYNGTRAQIFYVKKESAGHYSIKPSCSGLEIDTSANSSTSGANLAQWSITGAEGQKWNLIKAPTSGCYYLKSNLNRFIDVTDGKYAVGTNIQSCRFVGGPAQQWSFVKEDMSSLKPDRPVASVSGNGGTAVITWNSVKKDKYDIIYDVRLYNNATGSGDYYKVKWGVDGLTTSFTGLSEGHYSFNVAAVDKIDHNLFSGARLVKFDVDASGAVTMIQSGGGNTGDNKAEALKNLSAAITDAKAVSNADGRYTEDSYKALQDAIAAAEKVAADSGSTETDIQAAQNAVIAARKALTERSSASKPAASAAPVEIVDLPAVKISKPKAAKKAATVKWKKLSKKNLKKVKKIQIQYSLDKSFKTGVITKYAKAKKTSLKIKKLKSKKKYYVRIRAYTASGGVIHVSKWSSVKSVKAK